MIPITISPSGSDDTAAIQAADIQAMQQGAFLLFMPGRYLVNASGLTAHTSWLAPYGPATLWAMAQTWHFGTPMVSGQSGITLAGLGFDVSQAVFGSLNYPVLNFGNTSNWTVRDCCFTGLKPLALGIYAGGAAGFRIAGNSFTMPVPANVLNQAINVSGSDGDIVDNRCMGTGMDLAGSDVRVSRNRITNWAFGGGITVQPCVGATGFVITDNICHGGMGLDVNNTYPSGIEIWAANSVIAGNSCHGNSGFGIVVGGPDNTVSGNSCMDNGQAAPNSAGIILYSIPGTAATGNTVTGNTCTNTTGTTQQYGIFENAQSAPIAGNVFSGNNLAGNARGESNTTLT